jgi:hypothetical protein
LLGGRAPFGVGRSECRSNTKSLLIFLDRKNARPDDLSEAVIGNFHKKAQLLAGNHRFAFLLLLAITSPILCSLKGK